MSDKDETVGFYQKRSVWENSMTTIREIAELADVSTTTVSNVIHGKTKRVSPATIQKIERLIKEQGYVPKMGLRVLNKA